MILQFSHSASLTKIYHYKFSPKIHKLINHYTLIIMKKKEVHVCYVGLVLRLINKIGLVNDDGLDE